MNPSEIAAPPSLEQLYAMLGEAWAELRMLKIIMAQHPEVFNAYVVPPAAPNGTASSALVGVVVEE